MVATTFDISLLVSSFCPHPGDTIAAVMTEVRARKVKPEQICLNIVRRDVISGSLKICHFA
jgi:hypothetical protein